MLYIFVILQNVGKQSSLGASNIKMSVAEPEPHYFFCRIHFTSREENSAFKVCQPFG
jgi:hypothetical protein